MGASGKVSVLLCGGSGDLREFEVSAGLTVAQALEAIGLPVKTPCGGAGHCCSCTTKVWRKGETSPIRVRACREKVAEGIKIYPAHCRVVGVLVPPPPHRKIRG